MPTNAINHYWRLLATGFSFALFGVGALCIGLCFKLVSLIGARRDRRRWTKATIRKSCLLYIKIMRALGVLSFSYSPDEFANIKPGSVVIANHPGLLDAIFILALCDNLTCIVKGDLFRNPYTAHAVKLAGYLPNDDENLVNLAIERLQQGENILIFPEGTRNTSDDQLAFKRGAANIVILAGCAIVPILIQCVPRTLQKGAKWYNIPHRAPHFSFSVNPEIAPKDCIDISKPRTVQYRHLTDYLARYYRAWFAQKTTCESSPQYSAIKSQSQW